MAKAPAFSASRDGRSGRLRAEYRSNSAPMTRDGDFIDAAIATAWLRPFTPFQIAELGARAAELQDNSLSVAAFRALERTARCGVSKGRPRSDPPGIESQVREVMRGNSSLSLSGACMHVARLHKMGETDSRKFYGRMRKRNSGEQ